MGFQSGPFWVEVLDSDGYVPTGVIFLSALTCFEDILASKRKLGRDRGPPFDEPRISTRVKKSLPISSSVSTLGDFFKQLESYTEVPQ